MRLLGRLALVGILVVALVGLGVYDASSYEERWPYPTQAAVVADYDAHVGEDALLFATVESVDGTVGRVRLRGGSDTIAADVRNFDATVQAGGSVQVYGRLAPDRTVVAEAVTVVNPSGGSVLFKYAVSLIAVALFLLAFFRHWRVDAGRLQVEARSDG